MSGGRFDYIDSSLKSEIYGWTDEPSKDYCGYCGAKMDGERKAVIRNELL